MKRRQKAYPEWVKRLLKAFSALADAYGACEAEEWELFKEKYAEFLSNVREAAEDCKDSAFLDALAAEALSGEFANFLDLSDEALRWFVSNIENSEQEMVDRYIDAFASLVNKFVDMREYKPELRRKVPWKFLIYTLRILKPRDPRTWVNAWRIRREDYEYLKREEEVDEEEINELREELKEYLLKAFALDRKDHFVPMELGDLYFDEGNYKEAIRYYKASIYRHPTSVGFEKLSEAYRRIGNYGKAIEALRRAMEKNPRDLDYYRRLVEICVEAGAVEEAKKAIEEFSRRDPMEHITEKVDEGLTFRRTVEHLRILADCYEKVGEIENALNCLERLEDLYRERIKACENSKRWSLLNDWWDVKEKIEELSERARHSTSRSS